ncbi:hypothetical protein V2P20_15360 [Methylobacter sp. Wu1]|uniref:hypothetical protein n=1 Tax=Methylobacter sp. Wu1 TaxID=3119359 RepID=UPI002F94450F
MSQNRTLHIEIIRDRHAKPLAIVKNFPGLDAEMYSDSLRKMAAQLIQAADDLEALNSEQAQVISLDDLMARQDQERGIKPLSLEPELLLDRIDQGGHSGQFLADAFISAYRTDQPFQHSLGELSRLDAEGFRLFHEILHIRHTPGWSDQLLYDIECQVIYLMTKEGLMETTASNAQTEQDQTNKPNIIFSHRAPFSVKKGDSFAMYHALYPILQRAEAVADLIEVACQETNKADFSRDTLWRSAETIRFEIKDARALLDAYYGVQP